MNFYNKFNLLCSQIGKRPSPVAEELGISKSTVSNWKTRGTMPTDSTLQKIAAYFGVDVDELREDEEVSAPNRVPPSVPDIKAAFWGGDQDLSEQEIDELWEDARAYIQFKTEQKKKGKRKQ